MPWAIVVSMSIWFIALLTARSTFAAVDPPGDAAATVFSIVWSWSLFLISAVFYFYKFVENLYTIFFTEDWWSFKALSKHALLEQLDKSKTQSPVSYWDAVSLFFSYPFVFNLLLYAVFETSPTSFASITLADAGAVRMLRLFALTGFLQHGIGFSAILAETVIGDLSAGLVGTLSSWISFSIFGSVVGIVVGSETFARRVGLR